MGETDTRELMAEAAGLMRHARGCDRERLKRAQDRLKKRPESMDENAAAGFLRDVRASAEERRRRKDWRFEPDYPVELPIVGRRGEIVDAIRRHQVIVLSGETGSGKTTQIPKMCIEAGRGIDGLIGCTQPRRIAAMTVAARIAEELKDDRLVGYKIRFHENSDPANVIRVMTDGMLLAEAQGRPALHAYDTIIVDEAHERSLNIDVLLGLLRRLIDRRRDLKLIITSATLDTAKFSQHFRDAPVIEVSGRTYPVDIRYEEPEDEEGEMTLAERTAAKIDRLVAGSPRGDILAFLPTEQDIRETIDVVGRMHSDRLNIVPLFARLPASEQKKAFSSGGRRKLVVATNVAETSLTIPGIRYVVDSGLARINRYHAGSGTHGLPVEPISRASADQRAGRCGRVQDGICIRMYSEEDYRSRPEFTAPEIRRTNLAEVILRLLDLGIRDIEAFPFVDPPESAGVRDGMRTLKEIGALAVPDRRTGSKRRTGDDRRLSEDGRIMARLPLDPRLSRVLIQADREGCLGDILPIAAALSLPDPRERPPEKIGSADRAHAAFLDGNSDFIGWLNIWDGFRTYGKKGSYSGKLKKFCSENYLSFRRMKEWMDVHRQLALIMEENGYRPRRMDAGPSLDRKGKFTDRYAAIHRALLSGFLSHIARHEDRGGYEATRNRNARIHPSSALVKTRPDWIMAAELVRTSRLYARSAAAIDPEWLARLGAHLAARTYKNARWSRKEGAVLATEQMRLYGFLISDDVTVPYGPVRPEDARTIFIRSALVEGDVADISPYGFLKANRRLYRRLSAMENKLRRRDLLAGEDAVAEFYAARLPKDVLDIGTLNKFIRTHGDEALRMDETDLLTGVAPEGALKAFPDAVDVGGERWKVSYRFDPESKEDGVTVKIPSGRLSDLRPGQADWLVPGLLEEKVEALMRGLPKMHRRKLIPIPQTAVEALEGMNRKDTDLPRALSEWLYADRGVDIPPDAWNRDAVPSHLNLRFSVLDDSGRESAAGRDPSRLQSTKQTRPDAGRSGAYRKEHERHGLRAWPPGDIPETVDLPGGSVLRPALADEGESVGLVFLSDRDEAEERHRGGQVKLARLHWAREIRDIGRSLPLGGQARVNAAYLGGARSLEEMLWQRALEDLFGTPLVRKEKEWNRLVAEGGRKMHATVDDYRERLSRILDSYGAVRKALDDLADRSHRSAFVNERLKEAEALLSEDFVRKAPLDEWTAMPRWLEAVLSRARKGADDPAKDRKASDAWLPLKKRYDEMTERMSPMASEGKKTAMAEAGIMVRELYVALFAAGEVRAAGKVSESRVRKRLDEIGRML